MTNTTHPRLTWAGLALVGVAAAVLSFDALRQLAAMSGTPANLAWLLPLTIDAAALVATRLWLARGMPERTRSFARGLALTMIGASVAGNAVAHWLTAYQVAPPWWSVVAVAAVPPAVLGAVAHMAALATREAPPIVDEASVAASSPGDLVGRARYLVAAGEAAGDQVGRTRLARELNITENQARQLLKQIHSTPTLRAVGAGETR